MLRKTNDLWPKAGRVLLTMRPWLPTKAVAAVRLSRKVLSDVWWPLVLVDKYNRDQREKALVVWLNSTPALILLLGRREETRGAWIQFKKPTLRSLPVLDVLALGRCVDREARKDLLTPLRTVRSCRFLRWPPIQCGPRLTRLFQRPSGCHRSMNSASCCRASLSFPFRCED